MSVSMSSMLSSLKTEEIRRSAAFGSMVSTRLSARERILAT